jgi:hypothetical protein
VTLHSSGVAEVCRVSVHFYLQFNFDDVGSFQFLVCRWGLFIVQDQEKMIIRR